METKSSRKFKYSFDLSGTDRPTLISLPIATATAIELGERIKIVAGLVVSADEDAVAVGFSSEDHDGSSDGETDVTIKVYASPTAVMVCRPASLRTADATSGAGSFVDLTLAEHADDAFNGGVIKVVDATNLVAGAVVAITDFNGTTGAIAVAGTYAEDDTALLFPPVGSIVIGLDADGTNLDMAAAGAALIIIGFDVDKEEVYVANLKHQFAGAIA